VEEEMDGKCLEIKELEQKLEDKVLSLKEAKELPEFLSAHNQQRFDQFGVSPRKKSRQLNKSADYTGISFFDQSYQAQHKILKGTMQAQHEIQMNIVESDADFIKHEVPSNQHAGVSAFTNERRKHKRMSDKNFTQMPHTPVHEDIQAEDEECLSL
jgi:hypothetical protein